MKLYDILCCHCWHDVKNSARKIKAKTRCRKLDPYLIKGSNTIKVQSTQECCICTKRKIKRYKENYNVAFNYPDIVAYNIRNQINDHIAVNCFKDNLKKIKQLETTSFSMIMDGDAPFSLTAIQTIIEEIQSGKISMDFIGGMDNKIIRV